ncbi:prepilin-type cleavage/methylation domain-containing protein [Bacillus sp. AFS015802]|uniref:type IV pilin protein n=1 Tax=Bacillus sp. AFS015802 TaxID=2033486 RepID=UPI000BF81030|nr:prepilin-type N-terminal cleavage/methylation domain-containing protein [Bacillus sp. AFS015802]PFA64568.1 prepilin-type cleavage/methylation domain-containing protein [Bacillus sp. AFS015802]
MLKKMKKMLKNERGLTLVELLAVIVILGIIAAIAVPSIGNIIEKSRTDAVKAEGIQVLNAAKLYVSSESVPDDRTLEASDLEDYLEENDDIMESGYTVTVKDDNTLTLSGTGAKGSVTIDFANASVKDINNAKKDAKTIPAPAPKEGE